MACSTTIRTASPPTEVSRAATPLLLSGLNRRRSGLTLLELLVVIVILGLVTAASIPILNPQSGGRRVREAGRMLAGVVQTARARAMGEGRSVGLWLEHQPGAMNTACFKLYLAEQPTPYLGESLGSTVTISGGKATFQNVNSAMINDGDILQINYQGHRYNISKTGGSYSLSSATAPGGVPPDTPAGINGLPFQVFRQPVRSAERPVILPTGVAIDLGASGMASQPVTGTAPLIIMFNSAGSLDKIYNLGATGVVAATDIFYLLVGRTDGLVKVYPNDPQNNVNDPTSVWVSISNQTGMVVNSENAGDSTGNTTVDSARAYAQARSSMGGR